MSMTEKSKMYLLLDFYLVFRIGKCNNPQFKDLLGEGCEFSISGKDIEINGSLSSDEYKSGRIFLSHTCVPNKPVVPFTITSTNCLQVDKNKKVYTARHNADAVGAVVLPRPDVSYVYNLFSPNFLGIRKLILLMWLLIQYLQVKTLI